MYNEGMYIQRLISQQVKDKIPQSSKVIVIYEAQRVVKTTIVNHLVDDILYE